MSFTRQTGCNNIWNWALYQNCMRQIPLKKTQCNTTTTPKRHNFFFQAPAKRRQNPARHTNPQDHDGALIQRLRTTTWALTLMAFPAEKASPLYKQLQELLLFTCSFVFDDSKKLSLYTCIRTYYFDDFLACEKKKERKKERRKKKMAQSFLFCHKKQNSAPGNLHSPCTRQ